MAVLHAGLVTVTPMLCTEVLDPKFAARLAGASYAEILENGGGIHSTVRSTRNSSEEELSQSSNRDSQG